MEWYQGFFFLFLNHDVFLEKSNSNPEIAHQKTSWYHKKRFDISFLPVFPRNFGVKHWYLKLLCRYYDFFQGLFSNLKLPGGTSVGVLATAAEQQGRLVGTFTAAMKNGGGESTLSGCHSGNLKLKTNREWKGQYWENNVQETQPKRSYSTKNNRYIYDCNVYAKYTTTFCSNFHIFSKPVLQI